MSATVRKSRWGGALVCAVVGGALFQFFGNATRGYIDTSSVFWWWGVQWFDPATESEHGLLILALSGWLLWRNLSRNNECRMTNDERRVAAAQAAASSASENPAFVIRYSSLSAVLSLVAALALHTLGFAAQQTRISIVAVLVFTWGVLRLGGGPRWGRAAVFPLGFLLFAIPLGALDTVGFWLRAWVIDASAALAHACGIGVLQNGTQLVAPDGRYHYDVVAECSGVRSLTAMVALTVLVGYLNFSSWWRRGVLLIACVPLVFLGNVARITSIIFAAQWGGGAWGARMHDVMGYGVFVIVLGGVLLWAQLLRRWAGESEKHEDASRPPGTTHETPNGPWLVAGLVALLAAGDMLFLHRLATRPPQGKVGVVLAADGRSPAELPAFLGTEWIGRRAEVTAIEREILPPDTGFARKTYVAVANPTKQVFVSVVLSGRDRTSIHRPELCLVGQGWTITGSDERQFQFPKAHAFPATVLRVKREVATPAGPVVLPQLTAYWFVGGDVVIATHWQRLVRDAWSRVAHGRADRWAYVLVQTDAADGEAAALARIQAVLDEALPAFQRPVSGRD